MLLLHHIMPLNHNSLQPLCLYYTFYSSHVVDCSITNFKLIEKKLLHLFLMSDISYPRSIFPNPDTFFSSSLPSDSNSFERICLRSYPRLIEVEFPFGDPPEQCLADACERTSLYLPIIGVRDPKGLMAVTPNLQSLVVIEDILFLNGKYQIPACIQLQALKANESMKFSSEKMFWFTQTLWLVVYVSSPSRLPRVLPLISPRSLTAAAQFLSPLDWEIDFVGEEPPREQFHY